MSVRTQQTLGEVTADEPIHAKNQYARLASLSRSPLRLWAQALAGHERQLGSELRTSHAESAVRLAAVDRERAFAARNRQWVEREHGTRHGRLLTTARRSFPYDDLAIA